MIATTPPGQARWSSRAAFVLAATGSAVGLGNLWRFQTEAGMNGGGAFVFFYILFVALIAAPLLLSETLIGRHGQRSTIGSAAYLARQSGASPAWSALAVVGLIAGWLAGMVMKGGGYGILGDLIVGLIGSMVGGFLVGYFVTGDAGFWGSIFVAFIGACVMIAIVRAVSGSRARV